jgi:membrane peptidoglycan carboxypeptidase
MTPYLVDQIRTADGRSCSRASPKAAPTSTRSSPPTATASTRACSASSTRSSAPPTASAPNIVVAGKTGTAQVGASDRVVADADAPLAGFNTTQDHSWFAAYAPADDPQIVVVAFVEHGGAGADAAAPIVMTVLIESYLGRSSSQPGGPQPRRTGVPPPLPGQRAREEAQREDSTVPSPDREVALTGARLPGESPAGRRPDRRQGPRPVPRARYPPGQARQQARPQSRPRDHASARPLSQVPPCPAQGAPP